MSQEAYQNPADQQIKGFLASLKTVAVVGLSPDPQRDSHRVASYLQKRGLRVIPVNPKAQEILGEKVYADLAAIPHKVDLVDVFRASEHVPEIARQALDLGARGLWLQEGVVHDQAASRCAQAGLLVVQNKCLKTEHARLLGC